MKISIYLDQRQQPTTLRLTVAHHNQRALLTTGITLNANQWDAARQRIINHPRRVHLQRIIDGIRRTAETTALNLAADDLLHTMTAAQLRDHIRAAINGEELESHPITLLDRFDAFASLHTNPRTYDIYQNTARMIRRTVGDIPLDSINKQWLDTLDAILTRNGAAVNTRAIHFRNIRAVINDAIDNELTTNYPFRRFTIKQEQTRHRTLTAEELRRIIGRHTWYTDMFLLSFLLIGINAADMAALTPQSINHGRIEYTRKKTRKPMSVKLEPEAVTIIERYRGSLTLVDILDRYRNVHNFTASMGKQLGRLHPGCTMYYARHTWATIAYSLGIPMDTISRALGHSFTTGAAVTAVYVQADNAAVDAANRRVIDYTLGRR